jgi:aryl-alcohol dehydrogenase-like predicted oxidoreductase
MQKRKLGKSNLEVSAIGFGSMGLNYAYSNTLTGTVDAKMAFDSTSDLRASFPRFTPEARKANQPVVDLLSAIARRKKVTPAQIALAGLLAQKPWIVPIPGTRTLERMVENIGAAEVKLTSADLREIESAFSKITVKGARLSEDHMKLIDR